MLTEEQIKNLKEGDPLIVNVSLKRIDADGDIWIAVPGCPARWFPPDCVSLPSEHGTFSSRRSSAGAETEDPTPKHSPTRLFKEGDKVRVVARDGRSWWQLDPHTTISRDEIYTVLENEEEIIAGGYGELRIEGGGKEYELPFCFLELVTPVEEMEPYMVETDFVDDEPVWNIYKDGDLIVGYTSSHPNAKAAAEAECARLNAEWRKEQE